MLANFRYNLQYWPYALIAILFSSWLMYLFVAPKSWREWSRAGLLQTFIIALYAEMYGFPLTIYLLSGLLGIDIPRVHDSGHLWATLLGYGRVGAEMEMLLGSLFILAGALLIIRGWVRIYEAAWGNQLMTTGIYQVVRHPQYAGIFLAIFGELVHWPTVITLALSPVVVWAYVRLARQEEARLVEKFGDEYRAYQSQVPMFFPRWIAWPWRPQPL
jgi:protein-S-isoprenylcysteine O-methyltransferase Ste14